MKQIPIGIQDFKVVRDRNKYFVDKSILIGRILDSNDCGVFDNLRGFSNAVMPNNIPLMERNCTSYLTYCDDVGRMLSHPSTHISVLEVL